MPIRVNCPKCNAVINAPDSAAGRTGKCPKCAAAVPIPKTESAPLPPAPGSSPASANPVQAKPLLAKPVETSPKVENFDVEIEDDADFDVEMEDEPKPSPVPAAIPVPANAVPANPFAVLGPPPDSAAAKLGMSFDLDEVNAESETPGSLEPMHPGWREVQSGLGQLKLAAMASVAAVLTLGAANGYLSFSGKLGPVVYALLGLGILIGFGSMVLLLIGLFKSGRAPEQDDGGPGPGLAKLAFYLALAGLLLAPCGIGLLLFFALPFVIGIFLRRVGEALPSPSTSSAAMRYMIATGTAIVFGMIAQLMPIVLFPILFESAGKQAAIGANICFQLFGLFVQLVSLLMYYLALSTAISEIAKQLRLRKVQTLEKKPREEAPVKRKTSKSKPVIDDNNPFA
jgi:hypothetical protein